MNYEVYHLSRWERTKVLGIAAIGIILVTRLFYDNYWGLLGYPFLVVFLWKRSKEKGRHKRKEQLLREFMDALRVVNTSLSAGLSIENAWMEAKKEILALHGNGAMYMELQGLEQQLALSHTVEEWLSEFAERSGVDSIQSFADVFSYAKRCGGNLTVIVDRTTQQMREKFDTEAEIQVLLAKRRLEQKVMEVIPVLILGYLRLSSGDYMEALYGNLLGAAIMTGCLIVYGISIYWANQILAIEV